MTNFVTSDNVRLSYTDGGAGRPVVFVAGFTAPATIWALNVDAVREAGFRAATLDRRSHGLSDSPDWGQRIARHGKDIVELIGALELHDPILVGASMGASSCWAAADLTGFSGIGGIVSVDQSPKMINDESWHYGFYDLTEENAGVFFRDGIPHTGRGLPDAHTLARLDALSQRTGSALNFGDPDAVETKPLLFDHAMQDWRDVINRSPIPVLMMAGAGSQLWPAEHVTVAADNPLVTRAVIEDAGHPVNIDQPDRFNAALLHFLHTTTPRNEPSSLREPADSPERDQR